MRYLYLDTETDKVILIAKEKIENHPNTEYAVSDTFDLTKDMGDGLFLEGFLTATEFLDRYNADYVSQRAAEYPSIEDQLDEIYHNGIDAWKINIKETKDKYPKG